MPCFPNLGLNLVQLELMSFDSPIPIGCTVCEIFAFKLYCDLGAGVRVHSRSSKAALFNSAHMTFHSKYASIYYHFRDIAALVENRYPCIRRPCVRSEAVRFTEQPLVTKN